MRHQSAGIHLRRHEHRVAFHEALQGPLVEARFAHPFVERLPREQAEFAPAAVESFP